MTGAFVKSFFLLGTAALGFASACDGPTRGFILSKKSRDEFGAELGSSQEASHFGLISESRPINRGFRSLLGNMQPLPCEHFSHVLLAPGSNNPLFIVGGQSMLSILVHYFVKIFIMLFVVTPNYSHIIMQVISTWAILQYVPC